MTSIQMDRKKFIKADRFAFLENSILRILFYATVILVLAIICLLIGLVVGYAVIGDGNPLDVFNWQTWQHILDYIQV